MVRVCALSEGSVCRGGVTIADVGGAVLTTTLGSNEMESLMASLMASELASVEAGV